MTATFTNTLPTAKDRMRYQLGDVNVAVPLEQDETYAANLTLYGEELGTAVMAEALASRYAQKPDSISDDSGSITWRERVKTWLALATRIRSGLSAASSSGVAGSITGTRGDEPTSEYVRPTGATWWTG